MSKPSAGTSAKAIADLKLSSAVTELFSFSKNISAFKTKALLKSGKTFINSSIVSNASGSLPSASNCFAAKSIFSASADAAKFIYRTLLNSFIRQSPDQVTPHPWQYTCKIKALSRKNQSDSKTFSIFEPRLPLTKMEVFLSGCFDR